MTRYSFHEDNVTHSRGLGQSYVYDWREDKVIAYGDPNAMIELCNTLNTHEEYAKSIEDKVEAVECLCYMDK